MINCQICRTHQSKYSCPSCPVLYCSIPCYKKHKATVCLTTSTGQPGSLGERPAQKPLRSLTSLQWPYVPEESAYPDPLKRDDPKVLQLHQYEAIATSAAIRKLLTSRQSLRELLISIDKLRGQEREEALQKALGVTPAHIDRQTQLGELGDDVLALRELAEAIEVAVRGENKATLGLDWGDALE